MKKSTSPGELDPGGPLPLYEQIRIRLSEELATQTEGDRRLYSDAVLMKRFGVSRMTVRNAVDILVRSGFMRRVPGRGTFVTAPPTLEVGLDGLERFLAEWHAPQIHTRAKILAFRRVAAAASVARELDVAVGSPVLLVRRLRSGDDGPVVTDERFVAGWCMEGITRDEAATQSLFVSIEAHAGVRTESVEQRIRAGSADKRIAALLETPLATPTLERHVRFMTAEGRPTLSGHSVYRADRVTFELRATRALR
ncbi:MAG: GntR family transcriptional regulator [Vulcanimicrobiaceae bacterium]